MKSKRVFEFGSTSSSTNAAAAVVGNIGAAIGVGAGPTAMPAAGQLFNFTATPQQQQMQVKNSTVVNYFLQSLFLIIVI